MAIALANSLAIQARLQAQSELVGAVDAKQQAEEQATLLQATNQSLATKEERLRHQQSATLALVQDRTVFEGSLPVTAKQLTTIAAQALLVDRVSVWIYDEQTQSLYCLDQYDHVATQHTFGQKLLRGQYPHYLSALDRGQLIAAAGGPGPDLSGTGSRTPRRTGSGQGLMLRFTHKASWPASSQLSRSAPPGTGHPMNNSSPKP